MDEFHVGYGRFGVMLTQKINTRFDMGAVPDLCFWSYVILTLKDDQTIQEISYHPVIPGLLP